MNPTDGSPTGAPLAIPGLVFVAPTDDLHPATVELDPAAGFRRPRGIRQWSHEASVVRVADLTDAIRKELGVQLPHEQLDAAKFPHAHRAAKTNPLVAVPHELVAALVGKGVRVHTVGFDKITSGFFYLAEGAGEEQRVQGDLIEMLGPILQYGSANEDIERHLGRVVDRLLSALSGGAVNELRVELADALPTLAAKGAASTVDVAAFEDEARALAEPAKKWETRARELASALEGATARKEPTLAIPLYGEARRVTRTEMELDVRGKRIVLPGRVEWVVSGEISDAPRAAKAAAAPATSQVDEAWGEDEAVTAKPAAAAAKPIAAPTPAPTPSPVAAKVAPSPSPSKVTPAPTPSPIAAKVAPSPSASKVTPAPTPSPIAAKVTPSPSTPKVTPAPTPSPVAVKPATAARPGPLAARLITPAPVMAATPTPAPAQAVVATRITTVSGAGAGPVPVPAVAASSTSKPRVEEPVARAAAAVAASAPAAVVEPPEADDDDDDGAEAPAEKKGARKLSKKERKAQKTAERRAAAEAANRAANAPKAKSVAPTKAEPKPADKPADKPAARSERPKAAAAAAAAAAVKAPVKSVPAPKKPSSAPPAAEPPTSSFGTIGLVLLVLLALAAAGWWFFLRHK